LEDLDTMINRLRIDPETIFGAYDRSKLKRQAVVGGSFSIFSQISLFIINIIRTILLARVLIPLDFGLFAMVSVISSFAIIFRDAGLTTAIIQVDCINSNEASTMFTFNILINLLLSIAIFISSPFVASFYGHPILLNVTRIMSISFFLSGLSAQHIALLTRSMRFDLIALNSITTQIVSLLVAYFFAIHNFGIFSLVFGSITSAVISIFIIIMILPWIPNIKFEFSKISGLIKYGRDVLLFNVVNYFSRNSDNILIGKFIGAIQLGFYNKAYSLFMLPILQIRIPVNSIALPLLSKLKKDNKKYKDSFYLIVEILAFLSIPISIYLYLKSEFIILLVLGENWIDSVEVFRILSIFGLLQVTAAIKGTVLLSFGYSKKYLHLGVFSSIVTILSFLLGIRFGITGVAYAYVIAQYAILFPSLIYSFNNTPIQLKAYLQAILPFLFIGLVLGIISHVYFRINQPNNEIIPNLIFTILFFSAYLLLTFFNKKFWHKMLSFKNIILQ